VGAVGGRNFASPIDKAHRLYNSLLLPHKPWQQQIQLQQITFNNLSISNCDIGMNT